MKNILLVFYIVFSYSSRFNACICNKYVHKYFENFLSLCYIFAGRGGAECRQVYVIV